MLKVVDTSPLCEKDFSSACLHLLHLCLPSESVYSFWKLLILEPQGQALRAYQLVGSSCFCPVRCDTFLLVLHRGTSSQFWRIIWGLVSSAAFHILQKLCVTQCTSLLLLAERPTGSLAGKQRGTRAGRGGLLIHAGKMCTS